MENGKTPILVLENMSKTFGTIQAVQDVSLRLYPGEVRGLIGENGSGKSTLAAMVCGSLRPDAGKMRYRGEEYRPSSVLDARRQGIGILLQERGTIDGMTVAENLFIGRENDFRGKFGISKRKMQKAAAEILHAIGADQIDPAERVERYKFEERKLVEVARVMYADPQILIVDETTSALSLAGREAIYAIIERLRSEGKSVIFIGHDLDEIIRVCDTATVLRDGCYVDTLQGEGMTPGAMRSRMIGRENLGHYYREDFVPRYCAEETVLQATHLNAGSAIRDVSLALHRQEILGICGLSDSGMHELAKALFGGIRIDSGTVTVGKASQPIRGTVQAVKAHIAYLPKDRDSESLFLQSSIQENISITCFDQKKIGFLLNKRHLRQTAQEQAKALNIKCSSLEQLVSELSGGNKQKVVVAKWLANQADILIMDCPTRGIDVGVKAAIYDLICQMKEDGKSIVMLSEEMAEVIGMADRILVIKDGAVSGEFMRSAELTEHMIVEKII